MRTISEYSKKISKILYEASQELDVDDFSSLIACVETLTDEYEEDLFYGKVGGKQE